MLLVTHAKSLDPNSIFLVTFFSYIHLDLAPLRILVVGQTPPPFGGQAVMIEALLKGRFERVELFHVRLAFSDDMESVGKFEPRKLWVLFTTIIRIWIARFSHRTSVLYYPPSGPNIVPVLRDILLLNATRWLFRHTVFHFHAGGVAGFAPTLPALIRPLFNLAYRKPTLAIRTAPQNPEDGKLLGAKYDVVVPNGIPDMRGTVQEHSASAGEPITILFTGVLVPSKGVKVLLEAFKMIVEAGAQARLELMGKWGDDLFRRECEGYVATNNLQDRIRFLGVKRDHEKNEHFAGCDIFCFPSYFEAESFGLVLVEAMQFAKPVVTTQWRGIPSVAQDGINGFTVPVQDAPAVAEKLMRLINDAGLRDRMGQDGRRIFEERFTLERFHENMENALVRVTETN